LKNVLVTGGAGFIGRHLVDSLLKKGYRVVVLDIAEPFGRPSGNFEYYREDIRNTEAVEGVVRQSRIDTCIHLAAKVSVTDSVANPDDTLDTNVKGTMSVLEACARNKVRNFVFASSAAVYGEAKELPIREDAPLKPLSPYGESKVAGEQLVATYKAYSKIENAISLRFFNVYGENQNPVYAGVISKFAERLSKGLPPIIYGDGNQTRDFISVRDVVRAIELVANTDLSDILNIAMGRATSLNELARKMAITFGINHKPIYENSLQGDIVHSLADVTKFKNQFPSYTSLDLDSELKNICLGLSIAKSQIF
jgi:UDP-glucose 4-epimerase